MGRDSFLFLVVAILSSISNSVAQDSDFVWSKTLSFVKDYVEKMDELPAIAIIMGSEPEEGRDWRPQDNQNYSQVMMSNINKMMRRREDGREAMGTIFMFIYKVYYVLFSIYACRDNAT